MTRRLGVVINPIAGMGGRVGLHGTDGATLAAARARGAEPIAAARARRGLDRLRADDVDVLTAGGAMGADLLDDLGRAHTVVHRPSTPSTPDDTRAAVTAMADAGVDLILFAGGDGTARDVAAALDGRPVPVLGIPSGVKMHSAVFAVSPEAAADVAGRFLADPARIGFHAADVVDVAGVDGPRLFASVAVPAVTGGVQRAKATTAGADAAELAGLGRELAEEMEPGRLYLLGPGSTVARVGEALDLPTTPLGVDAVLDGRLVGTDLDEAALRRLLAEHPARTLVLGVVGGQGFLLGRGNQQLSPEVVAAIGKDNVVVLAAGSKIAALDPPVLRVDSGDAGAETPIQGYHRVRTARGHSTVLRIVA